jgi:hypothetical protein
MDGLAGEHIDFGLNTPTYYQPNQAHTVLVWMRAYLPQENSTEALLSQWTFNAVPGSLGWLFYRWEDAGKSNIGYTMRKNNTTFFAKYTQNVNWSNGEWLLLAAVYDGSGDENGIDLYVHDTLITDVLTASAGVVDSIDYATYATRLRVGMTHTAANAFRGRLLHSAVIGRALTPTEIAAIASLGKPIDLTTVINLSDIDHWCTCGDGCSTGAGNCPDLGTHSNDGTSQNGMTNADFQIADLPPKQLDDYAPLSTCVELDGGTKKMTFPWGEDPAISDKLTFVIWTKYSTGDGGWIYGDWDDTSGKGLRLEYQSDGDTIWRYSDGTTASDYIQASETTRSIDDGQWHMTGFTFDGTNPGNAGGAAIIYDGIIDDTLTLQGFNFLTDVQNTIDLLIGGLNNNSGNYVGRMCHSAVWFDRQLDRYDVALLYASEKPKDLDNADCGLMTDLAHWCRLGDGDAVGAGNMIDRSGNNNDGTFLNGVSGDFVSDVPS